MSETSGKSYRETGGGRRKQNLASLPEVTEKTSPKGVAKDLVVYHRRPGAQSQFSAPLEVNASSNRVAQAISFAREHLDEPLTVEQLAEKANPSPRQFARIFPEETGCTPTKVVAQLRVEAARIRLE